MKTEIVRIPRLTASIQRCVYEHKKETAHEYIDDGTRHVDVTDLSGCHF